MDLINGCTPGWSVDFVNLVDWPPTMVTDFDLRATSTVSVDSSSPVYLARDELVAVRGYNPELCVDVWTEPRAECALVELSPGDSWWT